jgi:hypothetical protein
MIDVTNEQLLTFPQAAKLLPGRVNISTLHRWRLRGVNGILLRTVVVGGRRYTDRASLNEFAAGVTAARDRLQPVIRTPASQERAIRQAFKDLEAAGIVNN